MKKLLLTSLLLTVGLTGCSINIDKPKDGKLDITVFNDEGKEWNVNNHNSK